MIRSRLEKWKDDTAKLETGKWNNIHWCWLNSNGYLHKLDGPALIDEHGTKWYRVDGFLHRIDGPAIEWVNGDGQYWVNGVRQS